MLLLLTNSRDITTDLVVRELEELSEPFVRLNCDKITSAHPTFEYGVSGRTLSFQANERVFDASRIKGAYLRRPHLLDALVAPNSTDIRYRLSEWSALLDGIYYELRGCWLNEPHLMEQAEDKIRQLRVAAAIGLRVPPTIISNDPAKIARFADRYPSVAKPLRTGVLDGEDQPSVIFTNRLSKLSYLDGPAIEAVPIIVQKEIPKVADIRVTIVGRRVFSTAIQSQADEAARVDWRRGDVTSMIHAIHELPAEEAARCVEVVRALGLRFGAIDLVLDPEGSYWFLEINPNGQWGWLQHRTNQPIARAIVDELLEISRS